MQQHNIFNILLVKKDNKLTASNSGESALFHEFIKNLEDGQSVSVFYEANQKDGTNDQLAKVHAEIRKLAVNTGSNFEDMKNAIKMKAGLLWELKDGSYQEKSFGNCSREELGAVIEIINEIQITVNPS